MAEEKKESAPAQTAKPEEKAPEATKPSEPAKQPEAAKQPEPVKAEGGKKKPTTFKKQALVHMTLGSGTSLVKGEAVTLSADEMAELEKRFPNSLQHIVE